MSDDARIIKSLGFTLAGDSTSLQDIGFIDSEIARALRLRISVDGSDVYWRADTEDPEEAADGGHRIVDGSEVELPSRPVNFTNLRFIGTADIFVSLMTSDESNEINFAVRTEASGASAGVPVGAATAAKQDTGNAILALIDGHVDGLEASATSIDTKTPVLGQALAAASTPVVLTAIQVAALTPSKAAGVSDAGTTRVVAASDSPEVSVLGATNGAAVITDANGTIQQYLRGIVVTLISFISAGVKLLAGENFIGKVGAVAAPVAVTFSLDNSGAYGSGDLLADTQVVTGALRVVNGTGTLNSIVLNDKDDQGVAMYVVILNSNVSLGTENLVPSVTDTNGDSILGIIPILAADWIDMGGCRIATKTGIGLEIQAATGTADLYIGLLNGTGTPAFTPSGITGKLGILKD